MLKYLTENILKEASVSLPHFEKEQSTRTRKKIRDNVLSGGLKQSSFSCYL